MKQTAMQQHIEWLTDSIEIAEKQAPTLVNTLNLCLNDAKHRLIMEKEHLYDFYMQGGVDAIMEADRNVEQYYNETFKSE